MDQTQQLMEDITGANIKLFRPPGGKPTSLLEPPSWLTIQETTQLQQLMLQLETHIQALETALKATQPWAIAEREYLAATLREQQAALSWVQQQLSFEQAAEGQYQAALTLAEQATLAAKAQQSSVAKTLWQQAIATLDSIPNTAFVSPLAQMKQRQYTRRMHQLQ